MHIRRNYPEMSHREVGGGLGRSPGGTCGNNKAGVGRKDIEPFGMPSRMIPKKEVADL